jgi:predicted phage tail protein
MARIRLNLRSLSIPAKIAKTRQIVTAMTDNKNFANPTPALTDVTAAAGALEDAAAQVQSARAEVSTRVAAQDNAESKLDQVLTQLAGYVESIAGKDDTLITSVGMEIKSSASTPTLPTVPQSLTATAGDHDGELHLSWKSVPNAKSYVIESSTDPATTTSWEHVGIATSATKTINSLKSGTRFWFRVAAVGAGGQSGWSEHATKVAP